MEEEKEEEKEEEEEVEERITEFTGGGRKKMRRI